MKEIDILILYEHVDRELDVACAVKCLLEARYGLRVKIIQHPVGQLNADAQMLWLKPKLVVLPHCYRSAVHAPYVLDWPEAIYFNLMWEQIFYQGNSTAKVPHGKFALEHVIHHAWGDFSAAYLRAAGAPQSHIFVNGHPAYMLYNEPYRRFYITRSELARRCGLDPERRWVFFPENYNWAFYSAEVIENYIRLGQPAAEVYAMRDFSRASFAEVIRWCCAAAAGGEIELIIRPRPATQSDEFKSAVSAVMATLPGNMRIIKDETVREWILASDVVVSSHSTSLIEAAVAGKPSYMLLPSPMPPALQLEWHQLAPHVASQAEFERVCFSAAGGAENNSLCAWAHAVIMAHGDAISNLADYLARLVRGALPRPLPVQRYDIPTPQGQTIANGFQFRAQQLHRKYQHLSVQLRRKPAVPGWMFEKDIISQAEIDRRTARWRTVLISE